VRILVVVDGSAACEAWLDLAARRLNLRRAQLWLVQVLQRSAGKRANAGGAPRCIGCSGVEVLAMRQARSYLDGLVSRYELPPDSTRCLVCQNDDVAEEIIAIAQNGGIDLIVMSIQCAKRVGKLPPGTVCSQVVDSSVCAVLCVPPSPARELAAGVPQWR
jgi:nucleotide-binding universal stress UspA family protein